MHPKVGFLSTKTMPKHFLNNFKFGLGNGQNYHLRGSILDPKSEFSRSYIDGAQNTPKNRHLEAKNEA